MDSDNDESFPGLIYCDNETDDDKSLPKIFNTIYLKYSTLFTNYIKPNYDHIKTVCDYISK